MPKSFFGRLVQEGSKRVNKTLKELERDISNATNQFQPQGGSSTNFLYPAYDSGIQAFNEELSKIQAQSRQALALVEALHKAELVAEGEYKQALSQVAAIPREIVKVLGQTEAEVRAQLAQAQNALSTSTQAYFEQLLRTQNAKALAETIRRDGGQQILVLAEGLRQDGGEARALHALALVEALGQAEAEARALATTLIPVEAQAQAQAQARSTTNEQPPRFDLAYEMKMSELSQRKLGTIGTDWEPTPEGMRINFQKPHHISNEQHLRALRRQIHDNQMLRIAKGGYSCGQLG